MADGRGETGTEVGAVLLDMDDTIFDHSLTCREAIRRLREETEFLRTRTLEELWQEYLHLLDLPPVGALAGLSSNELRARRWSLLARSCGRPVAPEEARALSGTYRAFYQEARRAVPGAIPLVRELHRRTPVAIVTNNELAEQEEKLRFLGLERTVDALVVSEAVGRSKPDPEIFAEALRRLGVAAEETVMVGDSWANDVLGARGAGIRPVWFNRFGLPRPDPAPVGELRAFAPVRVTADRLLTGGPSPGEDGRAG